MIGWMFTLVTVAAAAFLLLLLEGVARIPDEYANAKGISSYLLLTFFTTYWGKLNNPDFEFKTFFRIIFLFPLKWQRELRISFSYLIRIKIDDHYLLVRSGKKHEKNLKNKFQPVGGVYKMVAPKIICKKFAMIDDNMRDSPSNDLRKRLKNPFKIFGLLKWFHDKEDVEAAPFREFYEELVKTNIIPSNIFCNILFNKIEVKKDCVAWSVWNKRYEYKIFEIYEANLTEQQEKTLLNLKEQGHDDIRFLRRDDIKKYAGSDTPWGYGVTDHSLHILE